LKILFLTQLLPYPLDAGAKIRAFHSLQWLSKEHQITLLTFTRKEDSPDSIKRLQEICTAVFTVPLRRSLVFDMLCFLTSFRDGSPVLLKRDHQKNMIQAIRSLQARIPFDAIHSDQIWMASYVLKQKLQHQFSVLDQHNATFKVLERLAKNEENPVRRFVLKREAIRMLDFERYAIHNFDRTVWVSNEDRLQFSSELTEKSDIVIPIGVGKPDPIKRKSHPFRVTFIGSFNWPSNLEGVEWFVSKVWKKIYSAKPDLRLTLVGRNPPKRLARLSIDRTNVEVVGFCEDLAEIYKETAVFIVPILSGSGLRVKILDAWRRALPIVSTRLGAEALKFTENVDLLIADSPEEFASSVLRLLEEPEIAQRIIENGLKTVQENYYWQTIYPLWNQIYSGDHCIRPADQGRNPERAQI
jgi:glycosyltransferase involved in cell wall biosynthesis